MPSASNPSPATSSTSSATQSGNTITLSGNASSANTFDVKIVNGKLQVPDAPGLGVHLNWDRVWEANRLYNALPSHDRDDAKSMQYLIPGWKYDHKKPALVR